MQTLALKENILIDGGMKTLGDKLRSLISGNGPGYRFYLTPDGIHLTKAELLKLRRIPLFISNERASKLASKIIGREVRVYRYSNLVPTISRTQIAKALTGNISSVTEIKITHQQFGTGTTAPANGDTALETPNVGTKKTISSMSYSSNVMSITSFWDQGEATGTWREFGLFINTTTLFNRIAINITVAASDAITLDGEITIS